MWIHGGGFDIGWKDASGAGHGLVKRSQKFGSQGVILVSTNYRLGLYVSPLMMYPRNMQEAQTLLENECFLKSRRDRAG